MGREGKRREENQNLAGAGSPASAGSLAHASSPANAGTHVHAGPHVAPGTHVHEGTSPPPHTSTGANASPHHPITTPPLSPNPLSPLPPSPSPLSERTGLPCKWDHHYHDGTIVSGEVVASLMEKLGHLCFDYSAMNPDRIAEALKPHPDLTADEIATFVLSRWSSGRTRDLAKALESWLTNLARKGQTKIIPKSKLAPSGNQAWDEIREYFTAEVGIGSPNIADLLAMPICPEQQGENLTFRVDNPSWWQRAVAGQIEPLMAAAGREVHLHFQHV